MFCTSYFIIMFKKSINLGTKKREGCKTIHLIKDLQCFQLTEIQVDGKDYFLLFSVTSSILSKSPGCSESRRHLLHGVSTNAGMSAIRQHHKRASLPLHMLSLVYTSQWHGKITQSTYASRSFVVDTVPQITKSPCQHPLVLAVKNCSLYQHVNHFAFSTAPQV